MPFTPDEKLLFTTNGDSNDVSVIDVPTLKVVKSMPVGTAPWGVAVSEKKSAYFSSRAPACGTSCQPRPARFCVARWLRCR